MVDLSADFAENLVATAVDMLSISIAYQIRINQLGFLVGLVYAGLDAYLVIWERRRLTRLMQSVTARFSKLTASLFALVR